MKLFRLPLFLLLALCAITAHAQVTQTATATVDLDAGTTSLSTSISSTGSTDAVVIGVFGEGQTANPTITFGGQTPTLIQRNDAFEPYLWLYYVLPSGSGSQTITVTFGASCGRCALGAVAYSGVDQTTPIGTGVLGNTSSATTHSVTVTSATGGMVADVALVGWSDITVGAGQTVRYDQDDFLSVFRSFGMSDEAGAASVTMSWTTTTAADGSVIAVPLIAASGGSSSGLLRRRRGN